MRVPFLFCLFFSLPVLPCQCLQGGGFSSSQPKCQSFTRYVVAPFQYCPEHSRASAYPFRFAAFFPCPFSLLLNTISHTLLYASPPSCTPILRLSSPHPLTSFFLPTLTTDLPKVLLAPFFPRVHYMVNFVCKQSAHSQRGLRHFFFLFSFVLCAKLLPFFTCHHPPLFLVYLREVSSPPYPF